MSKYNFLNGVWTLQNGALNCHLALDLEHLDYLQALFYQQMAWHHNQSHIICQNNESTFVWFLRNMLFQRWIPLERYHLLIYTQIFCHFYKFRSRVYEQGSHLWEFVIRICWEQIHPYVLPPVSAHSWTDLFTSHWEAWLEKSYIRYSTDRHDHTQF